MACPPRLPRSSTIRTVPLASPLLHYADGEKRYIPGPKGLEVSQTVMSGSDADIKPGNALPLADIPVGTLIHAIEFQPGKGAAIARSAGNSCQLMGKEGKVRYRPYAFLRDAPHPRYLPRHRR